jgi:4-hydroxymandelate oxidase
MSTFEANRRQLLHFLLTSPVLAGLGVPLAVSEPDADDVITTARQALNVMDFEAAARSALPPAHFGYLATGVDDEATLRANREGFSHFSLRVRRLVNVREIDMSVSLFGTSWDSPIVLAPVSSQRAFHADGEIASARAARTRNHLQVLSTLSSTDVEAVCAARAAPVWYQLYATDQWPVLATARRATRAIRFRSRHASPGSRCSRAWTCPASRASRHSTCRGTT